MKTIAIVISDTPYISFKLGLDDNGIVTKAPNMMTGENGPLADGENEGDYTSPNGMKRRYKKLLGKTEAHVREWAGSQGYKVSQS